MNLKNELIKINNLSMDEQKERLDDILMDWMGENAQVDDILVIGTRVP